MSIVEAAKHQITTAVYSAKDKVNRCQQYCLRPPANSIATGLSERVQASDILIAAAPINIRKQDLADLEQGVSCT